MPETTSKIEEALEDLDKIAAGAIEVEELQEQLRELMGESEPEPDQTAGGRPSRRSHRLTNLVEDDTLIPAAFREAGRVHRPQARRCVEWPLEVGAPRPIDSVRFRPGDRQHGGTSKMKEPHITIQLEGTEELARQALDAVQKLAEAIADLQPEDTAPDETGDIEDE